MRLLNGMVAAALVAVVMGTAADAQVNPLSLYVGAGYGKETNSGAPSGSIGLLAGGTVSVAVLRVGAEVGYDFLGSNTVGGTKYTLSMIPVSAQLYYGFSIPASPVKPWLTIGAGPYTQRVETKPQSLPKVTTNGTKFGFNGGVGTDLSYAGGWKFGLDLRYHVIGKDSKIGTTESTKVITVMARFYVM